MIHYNIILILKDECIDFTIISVCVYIKIKIENRKIGSSKYIGGSKVKRVIQSSFQNNQGKTNFEKQNILRKTKLRQNRFFFVI